MANQPAPHFTAKRRGDFLWIDLPRRQMVLVGWPVMKAWRREPGKGGWQECLPYVDLKTGMLAPHSFLSHGVPIEHLRWVVEKRKQNPEMQMVDYLAELLECFAPVRRYFAATPLEVTRITDQFPQRQWQLLQWLARCGQPALELAASNPALAFCVATRDSFFPTEKRSSFPSGSELLQMTRRNICGHLGFTPQESTVKILSKINPEDCRLPWMRTLRKRLQHDWVRKVLAHLPVINEDVLTLLHSKYYESVTPALLLEVSTPNQSEPAIPPGEFLEGAGKLYQKWKQRPLPKKRFHCMEDLSAFFIETGAKVDEQERQAVLRLCFPSPPLPETETIRAIRTPRLLLQEAEEMRHCAGDYAKEIVAGTVYFYQVLAPERATVSVAKEPSGWRLSEVHGSCNMPVKDETNRALKVWLEEASHSLAPKRDAVFSFVPESVDEMSTFPSAAKPIPASNL